MIHFIRKTREVCYKCRVRWSILFILLACTPMPGGPPSVGDVCHINGMAACASETRLFICEAQRFVILSDCKGVLGCRMNGETAQCDTTGNSVGDVCAPSSEGKLRCDPDAGRNILRCVDAGLWVERACENGTQCGAVDAGLVCF
jgi:hypothetical protein